MTDPGNVPSRPLGLAIFGWSLILGSFVHVQALLFHTGWYRDIYKSWPDGLFALRYCLSWSQLFVGIYIGIGLLNGREPARKIAFVLGIFTISTLYWEHYYPAMIRQYQYLDNMYGNFFATFGYPNLTFTALALPSMIIHCLFDTLFFGLLMYYLTRPHVKKYFQDRARD